MFYGFTDFRFAGRITDDIELREKEGKKYCYFSIAINDPPRKNSEGETVIPKPTYYDMSAGGFTAERIARLAKKGSCIICTATPVLKKRSVEKDGVTTVYNNMVFAVDGTKRFEIFDTERKQSTDTAADTGAAPADTQSKPKRYEQKKETPKPAKEPEPQQDGTDEFAIDDPDLLAAMDELPI